MAWDKGSLLDESAFTGTGMAVRCYESHPVLTVGAGKLYGGSASYPKVKGADVYVALNAGSTSGRSSDPWEPVKVVEVHYSIPDMKEPTDVPRFKKMVTWLCTQLQAGKTVHVGCIGGHGRTGTVLSAIVAEMLGEKDAIQFVRKHYCTKAVESKEQIAFLMTHYGVSTVKATKTYTEPKWTDNVGSYQPPTNGVKAKQKSLFAKTSEWMGTTPKSTKVVPEGVTSRTKSYEPMASTRSLWKPRET